MSKKNVRPYTVLAVIDGQIISEHVEAKGGLNAFSVAAKARDDGELLEFVAALPGHVMEGKGIEFPGEAIVFGKTVLEQSDVFGRASDEAYTVIGRLYETDDVEVFHATAKNTAEAEAAFVNELAETYDCTTKQIKDRGYDLYAIFLGHHVSVCNVSGV